MTKRSCNCNTCKARDAAEFEAIVAGETWNEPSNAERVTAVSEYLSLAECDASA